ncbi:MAG: hypothetical protein DRP74_04765 [Candidatus Omnitrophota bacterium]|nr:MAG: hypothetical protein DRP74_04765 [Candidatus Omnitrophota bacterium]
MNLKKTHIVFGAFLLFWIIFIGWGMVKTTLKLFKDKNVVSETKKEEPLGKEAGDKPAMLTEVPKPQIPLVMVRVYQATSTDFRDILPVMGTVKGKTEVELRFEINGVIEKINFREGEKIKKGDLIANLDPKEARLKVTYAQNKLNSAQANYNSLRKKLEIHQRLFEAGAIIKSKLEEVELECDSAKFQVETARSEKELAENELQKTCLYASKDGIMGPRDAEEGEFVTPQDKIGSLFEINEVLVEVGVVERDINKIKVGQKAKVYVDAYPNIAFDGTVDNIYPVVEGKSRTLTTKIKVLNPEGLLLPGMFSRAEIFVVELQDALIIPTISLIPAGQNLNFVPAVIKKSIERDENGEPQTGTIKLKPLELGYVTSDYAQVTEGLEEDDLIVVEAQGEIQDLTKVKIIEVEKPSF